MTHQSKSYKKFVATAATATLVASALVPTASAAASDFTDVSKDYKEAVDYIVEHGFAQGTTETTFGTAQNISRGDAAVMIANALNLDTANAPDAGFQDVNNRVAPAVNAIVEAEIASGRTSSKFDPAAYITRQEMAKMLANAYELEAETNAGFTDVNSNWISFVSALKEAGITLGKTETTFAPEQNLTRGEFALFMFRAETVEVVLEVKSVTATDANTLSVTLSDNTVHEVTLEKALVSNVPTEVTFTIEGNEYTATVTYVNVAPEVVSVSAINAEEVLVTFSKDVSATAADKANYEISKNGTKLAGSVAIEDIKVTGNTALIRLVAGQQAVEGDKYVIQTTDAITTTTGEALPRYASPEYTYKNGATPALQNVDLDAATDTLTLSFDRPVASATTLVKVDGIDIVNKNLTAEAPTKAGNYKYTIALDGAGVTAAQLKSFKAEGSHEVVIFDVKDTAITNPVVNSVVNGAYTVTTDTAAPTVISVQALNANKFFVETNRAVDLTTASLKVEKGTHEFVKGAVASDFSVLDYEVGTLDGKPGVYVVVTDANPNGLDENPLYKGTESSANLKVTFENYKANDLIGAKYVGNVTLSKDATKPEVKTTALDVTNNKLSVTFKENLDAAPAANDVIVRDKDGVVIPTTNVALKVTAPTPETDDDSVVEVTFAAGTLKDDKAPYTVEFKAGKIQYADNKSSVADYIVKSQKNDKVVATVRSSESGFKYKTFADLAGTVTDTNNVIEIDYNAEMTDSARQAANYKLDGKALPAGTTVDFIADTENVKITLPEDSVKTSTGYKLTISTDVTTKAGEQVVKDLQTKGSYEAVVNLVDNTKPELKSAVYVVASNDATATSKIKLTFNEDLGSGLTMADVAKNLKVVINNSEQDLSGASVAQSLTDADVLEITLGTPVAISQAATITVIADNAGDVHITDASATPNEAKVGSSVVANTKELDLTAAVSLAQANADITSAIGALTLPTIATPGTSDNLGLPSATNGTILTWESSNIAFLTDAGVGVVGTGDRKSVV